MQPGPPDTPSSQPGTPASQGWWGWRRVALLSALVLGLCGLAVSATEVVNQILPRRFTSQQQHKIEAWDLAQRWRVLPEGTIFPATVPYQLPSLVLYGSKDLSLTAHRLGVIAPAPCAKGAGRAGAKILDGFGCTALLRATYTDSTGSMVATIGVAVLPSSAAAEAAESRLASAATGNQPGTVRPAPVPGTLASHFSGTQRQVSWNTHAGPYVILTTVGYTDGRPRVRVAADRYLDQEMKSLAQGLGDAASDVLGEPPPTPRCPGTPGC